jgi:hypothetical protein
MATKVDYTNKDQWLWCLHCERFFQVGDLIKAAGEKDYEAECPFCTASGHGDIYVWDSWVINHPGGWEHWPKSEKELTKGLAVPMYAHKEVIPLEDLKPFERHIQVLFL